MTSPFDSDQQPAGSGQGPFDPVFPPPAQGGQLPPSPFPGYFAQGQQPPGASYFAPGDEPKPATPGLLTVVIIAHWVLGALTMISGLFSTEVPGSTVSQGGLVSMALGLAAVAIGVALYLRPGNGSRIAATVLSALWCLSIIGAVIAVPIIVVLWKSQEVSQYFAVCDRRRAAQ